MKRKIAFALEGAFLTLQKACMRLFMGTLVYLPIWITEIPKMQSSHRKKRRKKHKSFMLIQNSRRVISPLPRY